MPMLRPLHATISAIATVCAALGASGTAHATPAATYVALGDSYSSGVGTGSYTQESGTCRRSRKAYPALWAAAHPSASFVSVACSGATTRSVVASQLSALNPTVTLVSVTVGGNDAGMVSVMRTCVVQTTEACLSALASARAFVQGGAMATLLDGVYSAIRSRAPNARVVVLDYPRFFQPGGTCLRPGARSRARINDAIDLLDEVTRSVAVRHDFVFADVRPVFDNHRLCGDSEWINSLRLPSLGESYHPTEVGHAFGYHPVFSSAAG